jgi:hypothetical protein
MFERKIFLIINLTYVCSLIHGKECIYSCNISCVSKGTAIESKNFIVNRHVRTDFNNTLPVDRGWFITVPCCCEEQDTCFPTFAFITINILISVLYILTRRTFALIRWHRMNILCKMVSDMNPLLNAEIFKQMSYVIWKHNVDIELVDTAVTRLVRILRRFSVRICIELVSVDVTVTSECHGIPSHNSKCWHYCYKRMSWYSVSHAKLSVKL